MTAKMPPISPVLWRAAVQMDDADAYVPVPVTEFKQFCVVGHCTSLKRPAGTLASVPSSAVVAHVICSG